MNYELMYVMNRGYSLSDNFVDVDASIKSVWLYKILGNPELSNSRHKNMKEWSPKTDLKQNAKYLFIHASA